jgi:peptide deformylase
VKRDARSRRKSMLEIVTLGREVLTRTAEPVKDIDDKIRTLAREMLDTMRVGKGIGLAAPQVDLGIRLFETEVEDRPRIFINPEIVLTSQELADLEEGCLSIPGIYAKLKRPAAVRIQAWNERGRPFNLDAEGLEARVILHELDHLNGVLFVDRLSEPARKRVLAQYERRIRM